MSDATGHMDWPGAGPFCLQVYIQSLPAPYYTHPDDQTKRVLLIKINQNAPDTLVRDFPSATDAHIMA